MRHFIYGVVLGLFTMYVWVEFDIPSKWHYLTSETQENARKSGNWNNNRPADAP